MLLRIFTEPQQGATYQDQLAVAQAAESLGFDAFFRSDHYLAIAADDGLPGPTDAWVTLAGIARETTRIRLGTLVTAATFRPSGPTGHLGGRGRRHERRACRLESGPGGTTASTPPTGSPSRRWGSGSNDSRSSWPSPPACGRHRWVSGSASPDAITRSRTARPCPNHISDPARR